MLVNSSSLLLKASKESYAVPCYNINNLEWTRYILEACEIDKTPVILGVTLASINYFGGYNVVSSLVKSLIKELNIKIPVVLHLDHGKTFEDCKSAIDAGFTSVMIDASHLSLEENIEITNKVIDYAKEKNVSVEAEIGCMNENEQNEYNYSSLEDCSSFVIRTGVDSLAPAIGNKHGLYTGVEKLNFELLGAICKEVKIPLVLHGASYLDENKLKTAIFCGVSKININTELQTAWASGVRKYLIENENEYDPRKIIGSGKKMIFNVIHEKNNILGCKNRAF